MNISVLRGRVAAVVMSFGLMSAPACAGELRAAVARTDVFARVEPEQKLRLVRALQAQGEVVAMTGDGVNDVPALHRANIGVAVGAGTDVAKEAADMGILDNRLSTIVAAVEEGRVMFANIKSVITFLLSDSLAELVMLIPAIVMGWPLPLLATQILWINLIGDSFPSLALTVEPAHGNVMHDKPQVGKTALFSRQRSLLVLLISGCAGIGGLLIFWYVWSYSQDMVLARSVVFTALAVKTLVYVFSIRSLEQALFAMNPFRNRWLLVAVAAGLVLQVAVVYVPALQRVFQTTALGTAEWILVAVFALALVVLIEAVKGVFIWRKKHHRGPLLGEVRVRYT